MKSTVNSGKNYAAALDDGANARSVRSAKRFTGKGKKAGGFKQNAVGPHRGGMLPRPFFKVTAEEYRPQFKENVEKAVAEITQS
jgi:hypothetical protein